MKLLFVTRAIPYPAHETGDGLIANRLLRWLGARHEVRVLSFGQPGDARADLLAADCNVGVELVPAPRTSLPGYYLSSGANPYAIYRTACSELRERLSEADGDPALDLIVLHGHPFSGYLPNLRRVPVVLNAIDAMSVWYERLMHSTGNPLRRLHRRRELTRTRRAERELYPRARAVVVVSDEDRRALAASSPASRAVTIPTGVDADYFHPSNVPPEPESLVFSGHLQYEPNADAVLTFHRNVWPSLRARRPALTWTIAGRSPSRAIESLGQRDPRIMVTGTVPDLRPFLWRSTIYVSPLRVGTGVKFKVLEAMACGKAIVATPESMNGIPAVDGEHVLLAHTTAEMHAAIERLLDDLALRDALAGRARALAESMSWPAVTRAYEALFEDVVAGRGTERAPIHSAIGGGP